MYSAVNKNESKKRKKLVKKTFNFQTLNYPTILLFTCFK